MSLILNTGEIHLWCSRPDELRKQEAREVALSWLTPDEVRRSQRFRFDKDRQAYLATRMLVRRVLSSYDPRPPECWRFTFGRNGRPEIAGDNPLDLRFNLSKSAGVIVCAVVRGAAIGVDVENVTRAAPLAVAERFFAPVEIEELQSLAIADRPGRFYDYWTLKESYLKARGTGLSIALDSFAFAMTPGCPPRLGFDDSSADDGRIWQFTQVMPTAEHLVSVCAEGTDRTDGRVMVYWQSLAIRRESRPHGRG